MKVIMVKFGGPKGERMDIRSVFLWGTWFSCNEQKDRQEGLFYNLGERLAVVGGNYLQGGKGPVHRRRVLDGST